MKKFVLSLDGGGIRGAASAQFLNHVENVLNGAHNTSIRNCVDFYAGTSTGSIIALALATTDLSVSDISKLYNYQNAKHIFSANKGWFEVDGINAPKYEGAGKTKILKSNMFDAKIGDVPDNKHVLVVTYGIEKRKPVVIKSTEPLHRKLKSYEVADASSAAPTYFPTTSIDIGGRYEEYWLVDGGVTANNPTMCAIAEAMRNWEGLLMDQMRVLSIGTGYRTRKINGPESRNWGALQWFTKGKILDVLTDERVVAYQAKSIIQSGNYIRVNAELKPQPGLPNVPDDAMDDISQENMKRLKELGDFWFDKYGDQTVALLLDNYQGPSLDRIDASTGGPIV